MYSAFRARCDDRRPRWVLRIGFVSIAARLDSAMTKRSVPTQVLTILPSLSNGSLLSLPSIRLIEGRGNASFAQAAAGAYSLPEVKTAQTILAVLAACAITATFIGRAARECRAAIGWPGRRASGRCAGA